MVKDREKETAASPLHERDIPRLGGREGPGESGVSEACYYLSSPWARRLKGKGDHREEGRVSGAYKVEGGSLRNVLGLKSDSHHLLNEQESFEGT